MVGLESSNDVTENRNSGKDAGVEPKVGMIFDNAEEAHNFYNQYATRVGFKVRIKRTNADRRNRSKIHRQTLVCSCEGPYSPRKNRENQHFNCKAEIDYKLVNGKYTVIKFISEHSHDIVSRQPSHVDRSQRTIDTPRDGHVNEMHAVRVGESQDLTSVRPKGNDSTEREEAGVFSKADAQFLLGHFKKKKLENNHFFYSFRINEKSETLGVFFCDAKSRRDYGLFCDVMCVDTTYRIYSNIICVLFVGISNHGQPTLFGCGLLDGESTDAMVWLFSTFSEAIGGKKPISIFTDQSEAIADAIRVSFPKSHHGLCLSHIYRNAATHVGTFKSVAPQLKACIFDPETVEEFEQSWHKLLQNGLQDNEWLNGLYELRQKWAQVYTRVHFSAGMTQRSESIDNFLKDYFGHDIALQEFVSQYSEAMANRREKEMEAENEKQQTSPILISGWSVEREAAQKYTKELFYCFQEEYRQIIDQKLLLERDDGEFHIYRVTEMEGQKRSFTLTYNHSEQSVVCTCRNFEFSGILCSHSLKLFRELEYTGLPQQYYMKRWTRRVIEEIIYDAYGDPIECDIDPSSVALYNELSHIFERIIMKAAKSKDVYCLTKSAMLDLEANVEAWLISEKEGRLRVENNTAIIGTNPMLDLDGAPFQDSTMRPSEGGPKCGSGISSKAKFSKKSASSKAQGGRVKETLTPSMKSASKAQGGRAKNEDSTPIITRASNIQQPTQESFGLQQPPSSSLNASQVSPRKRTHSCNDINGRHLRSKIRLH